VRVHGPTVAPLSEAYLVDHALYVSMTSRDVDRYSPKRLLSVCSAAVKRIWGCFEIFVVSPRLLNGENPYNSLGQILLKF
jgi:hypothetical protein